VRWLLDTNVCIASIRRQPESVLKRLRGKAIGPVGISSVTLAELEYGAAKSQRSEQSRSTLAEFLRPLEIAPFDDAAAAAYGSLRAALEENGRPMGPLDTLVAAQAIALSAVLVTHDMREFARIPGLPVEDWVA